MAQLLVQELVISRLDYCNALLAGLPASTTKPLQMIQNVAACLAFNQPKTTHVTPLLISLHWFPVVDGIKFKVLTLAFTTTAEKLSPYYNSLLQMCQLRTLNERRLVSSQRGKRSLSRTFTFSVPLSWNELPTSNWPAKTITDTPLLQKLLNRCECTHTHIQFSSAFHLFSSWFPNQVV